MLSLTSGAFARVVDAPRANALARESTSRPRPFRVAQRTKSSPVARGVVAFSRVAASFGETRARPLDRADDAPALAKMRVVEVLEALPNIGKVTAAKLMDELSIAPTRRVQGLGHRQKAALLERFGDGS